MRLELVLRLLDEQLEVGDSIGRDAGPELICQRECEQRGVAAGTASHDGYAFWIDPARVGEKANRPNGVADVHFAPAPAQALTVVASVTGTTAVVHVDECKTATGEELRIERKRIRRVAGGPTVNRDDEWWKLVDGRFEVRIRRRVEKGVRCLAGGTGEPDRLPDRKVTRIDIDRERFTDGLRFRIVRVEGDDRRRGRRRAGAASNLTSQRPKR